MKYLLKAGILTMVLAVILTACSKVSPLQLFGNGTAVTLTASSTNITPAPSDSNNVVASFSWTNPNYATDSTTQKFILEVDSAGRNFSKEITSIVVGKPSISFTGKQLNDMLAAFGFAPGQTFTFDIRVTSSYGNNNEALKSNVITVKIASYLVPITLVPSSTADLTLLVANASNKAISFNWNASGYGSNTINYALQMDTLGGTFANPQVVKYGTALTSSITVNDLNAFAISAGIIGGSTKTMSFRVVSYLGTTYATKMVTSNAVNVKVTSFTPVPPALYIVGGATDGGWNNPVPLPSQQFTRINAVSYGIVVNLKAGDSYLFLPLNGDWGHKYGGTSATGGALLTDGAVPGSNTPSPATSGLYSIVVNFQTATYTVTPFTSTIPDNLYIVGDATDGGWANPVPTPSQQFTKIDGASYAAVVNLTAGKSYLFLPLNGDWGHKYGGTSATGGTLLADGAVPANTPAPAVSGYYLIVVNFQNNTYTVTPYLGPVPPPTNLYIVGDATAGGWNNPVPTPSQQFTRISLTDFQLTVALTAGKSHLFLPLNGDWGHKFGGTSATGGTILADGALPANTPAPAVSGNYLIDVNFLTGQYTITKQ
ncbi:MAG: SusE domain-containing protein [Bacteroidota bacterium]